MTSSSSQSASEVTAAPTLNATNLRFKTISWFEDVVRVFPSVCLKYNRLNETIEFYTKYTCKQENQITNYQTLVDTFEKELEVENSANNNSNPNGMQIELNATLRSTVIIEWKDTKLQNGQFLYFDLYAILQEMQDPNNNTTVLSIIDIDMRALPDSVSKSAYFDESMDLNTKLATHDVLILSPLRSMLQRQYTNMGTFHSKHCLYLGVRPTIDFLHECQILLVFNCCLTENYEDVMTASTNHPHIREKLFNVAQYRMRSKLKYDTNDDNVRLHLNGTENENNNNNNNGNNNSNHEPTVQLLRPLAYLDKMVDYIDKHLQIGNVLIHCLAGANRSPFITACYLLKYCAKYDALKSNVNDDAVVDNNNADSEALAQRIYKDMKDKRIAVDPIGYDEQVVEYQAFLVNRATKLRATH